MNDVAKLFAQVNQRFADFLLEQSHESLIAFAEGTISLAFVDASPAPVGARGTSTPTKGKAQTTAPNPRPSTKKKAAAQKISPDLPTASEIAATLRQMESVEEGAAYLSSMGRKLTISALESVGAELGISLPRKKDDAINKLLTQAIGARRKFTGLRSW